MKRARPWIHPIGILIIASWLVLGGRAVASLQRPAQNSLPDAPGKAVVERVCTTCHGAGEMTSMPRTPPAWRETLELMRGYGADATEDEWKTITSYIIANVAFLNVNKAPAEDIASVLVVDQRTAEAIISYREKQGTFKSADDVKKAPGVDAARVEDVRARLMFEEN